MAILTAMQPGGTGKALKKLELAGLVKGTTPIPVKTSQSMPPLSVIKTAGSPTPVQQVQAVAATATPSDIQKGIDLLASGKGVLTSDQKALQQSSTNAAMLPKTKAVKEAEYIATLPQTSKSEVLDTITGNNYLLYGGVALVAVIVLILILKR